MIAVMMWNLEGDSCTAEVSPPTDDINDFTRVNPDGTRFIHIAEHPATLSLVVGRVTYAGMGKMNFNYGSTVAFNATGKVMDEAGNQGRAVCVCDSVEGTFMIKVNLKK
jgi:hypothetical protein